MRKEQISKANLKRYKPKNGSEANGEANDDDDDGQYCMFQLGLIQRRRKEFKIRGREQTLPRLWGGGNFAQGEGGGAVSRPFPMPYLFISSSIDSK